MSPTSQLVTNLL